MCRSGVILLNVRREPPTSCHHRLCKHHHRAEDTYYMLAFTVVTHLLAIFIFIAVFIATGEVTNQKEQYQQPNMSKSLNGISPLMSLLAVSLISLTTLVSLQGTPRLLWRYSTDCKLIQSHPRHNCQCCHFPPYSSHPFLILSIDWLPPQRLLRRPSFRPRQSCRYVTSPNASHLLDIHTKSSRCRSDRGFPRLQRCSW